MPTLRINDQLGATVDAALAPASTFAKYVKDLPAALLQGADLSRLGLLTLQDPAVQSLAPSLAFQQPVNIGDGAPVFTLRASAGVSFKVITGQLFTPGQYGDNIAIASGACYVGLGVNAAGGAGLTAATGDFTFGIDAGGSAALTFYHPFPAGPDAPTLLDAIKQSISASVLPLGTDDLAAMATASVVTIEGHGSLKFFGAANLLAIANPLATLALPTPVPSLAVQQGASATVGASWQVSTDYQVRVQKVDARHVRLGWYREHSSEALVSASVDAGISAGLSATDLFPTIIGAISSDAKTDLDQLQKASVPPALASSIAAAVKSAVDRKLQVGLASEFASLSSDEAAFLYEIDLDALEQPGKDAIHSALRGDLSGLTATPVLPRGITEIRSILTRSNSSRFSLRVNLLGIFNFSTITRLALSGTVTFTPSTGELVIADQATASRIQSASVNFGADEDKLRRVMAESLLLTAAYRGSKSLISAPSLSSSHLYFVLDASCSRDDMRRYCAIAPSLHLSPDAPQPAVGDFGRTTVFAEARYDDNLSRALFLRPDGTPRPATDYEAAGRRAIALLVLPDGDDAFRRAPVLNDAVWERMKDLGPANFHELFAPPQIGAITADYVAIQWWADSMAGTGRILAAIDAYTGSPEAPAFESLRKRLSSHMRDVAANAHVQFGAPWGLVAMFLVSERSSAKLEIVSQRLVYDGSHAAV